MCKKGEKMGNSYRIITEHGIWIIQKRNKKKKKVKSGWEKTTTTRDEEIKHQKGGGIDEIPWVFINIWRLCW